MVKLAICDVRRVAAIGARRGTVTRLTQHHIRTALAFVSLLPTSMQVCDAAVLVGADVVDIAAMSSGDAFVATMATGR